MKAKSKVSEVKEIRFTPNTDDHDFDFKAKHAENFLKDGNKVKAYVQFKGRAIQFQDRGQLLLLKFAERLAEVGILESMPKLEGRRMLGFICTERKEEVVTNTNCFVRSRSVLQGGFFCFYKIWLSVKSET